MPTSVSIAISVQIHTFANAQKNKLKPYCKKGRRKTTGTRQWHKQKDPIQFHVMVRFFYLKREMCKQDHLEVKGMSNTNQPTLLVSKALFLKIIEKQVDSPESGCHHIKPDNRHLPITEV